VLKLAVEKLPFMAVNYQISFSDLSASGRATDSISKKIL